MDYVLSPDPHFYFKDTLHYIYLQQVIASSTSIIWPMLPLSVASVHMRQFYSKISFLIPVLEFREWKELFWS